MTLLKSRSMTLCLSDSVHFCIGIFLQLVGFLAVFAIIVVPTAGLTQEATEKIIDQPSCVFELLTKSSDKPEKTDSTHFTFLCQEVSLPFIQGTWTFSNTSPTM